MLPAAGIKSDALPAGTRTLALYRQLGCNPAPAIPRTFWSRPTVCSPPYNLAPQIFRLCGDPVNHTIPCDVADQIETARAADCDGWLFCRCVGGVCTQSMIIRRLSVLTLGIVQIALPLYVCSTRALACQNAQQRFASQPSPATEFMLDTLNKSILRAALDQQIVCPVQMRVMPSLLMPCFSPQRASAVGEKIICISCHLVILIR